MDEGFPTIMLSSYDEGFAISSLRPGICGSLHERAGKWDSPLQDLDDYNLDCFWLDILSRPY
jgi:hypothetical protein